MRSALSVIRGYYRMKRRYLMTRGEDIAYPDRALIDKTKSGRIAKQLVYGYATHETAIDMGRSQAWPERSGRRETEEVVEAHEEPARNAHVRKERHSPLAIRHPWW